MALHTNLQIFKSAYDLLDQATRAVENMPRGIKGVIGERIVNRCIEITTLVGRTNRSDLGASRHGHLDQLIERVDEVQTLLRLSVERKGISRGQYANAIQLTQSVGRQAGGWRKASSNSPVPGTSRRPGQSDLQPGRAAAP